jgi:hypothetical protein
MAITKTHYELLKLLKERGELPTQMCSVLEIGEANVYGDWVCEHPGDDFQKAKAIYRELFHCMEVGSIDGDPSRDWGLKLDLNKHHSEPFPGKTFDVSFNHGTAEHIFDIGNVFRTMHDATAVGGLMIHECPFTGWLDHGFYCLQPTLFWDVARVNNYQVVLFATEHLQTQTYQLWESREAILEARRVGELLDNLMLFVALRKTVEAPFKVPIQGVYSGQVSEAARQAWSELR